MDEAASGRHAVPALTLNDGHTIPQLGFGVFQIKPSETVAATTRALEVGYRHIDTAEMYGNEAEVGEAVARSGIDRSAIFVTSKLNNGFHRPDDARRAFGRTLAALDVDYIDLFLIHWPLPTLYGGDFVSTWQTLIEFQAEGRARSIGVSNFQPHHLDRLADETEVVPSVNQVEVHPYLTQEAVRRYGADHGIATEAWSPIAQGLVLDDPVIVAVAEAVGRSPAQVVLRWHLQRGDIVIPKSVTPSPSGRTSSCSTSSWGRRPWPRSPGATVTSGPDPTPTPSTTCRRRRPIRGVRLWSRAPGRSRHRSSPLPPRPWPRRPPRPGPPRPPRPPTASGPDWPGPRSHENTAPRKHIAAAITKARRRPLPKGPAMRLGKKLVPVR